ncbi:hypothetical protein IAQ61_002641 [Plenodomus lingam]|uniref:uncharacterized protein n=1 Tax=Leptosphaeria maculans TaxID=5022 RepID=UPI003331D230|nr:hypothetical protein IAQ61_002641 [Plenodomus lingam]
MNKIPGTDGDLELVSAHENPIARSTLGSNKFKKSFLCGFAVLLGSSLESDRLESERLKIAEEDDGLGSELLRGCSELWLGGLGSKKETLDEQVDHQHVEVCRDHL